MWQWERLPGGFSDSCQWILVALDAEYKVIETEDQTVPLQTSGALFATLGEETQALELGEMGCLEEVSTC